MHAEVQARYSSPRVHAELNARGVACRVNAVAKLMRSSGIRAESARRFVRTTDSRHGPPVAGNALARDFAPAAPDVAWAMDFTDVPTLEGWLLLAVVVDQFSRRVVGGGDGRDDDEPAGRGRAGRGRRATASAAGTGGALGPGEPVRQ